MIKELIKSIEAAQEKPESPVLPSIINSPKANPYILEGKMMDVKNMSNEELFDFVKRNYVEIIRMIFSGKENEQKYLSLFLDNRFLTNLVTVLSNTQQIPLDIKMNACKIAFDYMSSTKMQKDEMTFSLIKQIAEIVNRDTLFDLLRTVPRDLALYLTVAKYSTNSESINIQRMNFIIAQTGSSVFNEQKIIDVFIHFGKYSGMRMTNLLESHMFSVDPTNMTEDMEEMYSVISLAILDMMNHMSSQEIRQVLMNYSNDFMMKYNSDYRVVRFSLRNLSGDYDRITMMADMLSNEGYNIP